MNILNIKCPLIIGLLTDIVDASYQCIFYKYNSLLTCTFMK